MAGPIRKLGPYTLISRIGQGGFGVVWLAEKRTAIATTQFALKLPRGEDIDLEAFKQEAAIWIQASGHPNVLPLIDADIYDDQVVIVSEYVSDGSLAGWLKQHSGKAPSAEASVEIMDGVLAGLNHLHSRRIIHRDLKPENILLQRETPRLADFGIARLLKSSSHSAQVSGTLAYMAPEAFDGNRNEQTDVWSVGVIFYEMLAGRLPYDQQDIPSFIGAIMRHDPPPLPDAVPEVLRDIVTKALQRDPANRYLSAAEMRRDLREAEHKVWLGGRKTLSDPPLAPPLPEPIRELVPERTPQPTLPSPPAETQRHVPEPTLKLEVFEASAIVPLKRKLPPILRFGALAFLVLFVASLAVGIYVALTNRPNAPDTASQHALRQTLVGHNNEVHTLAYTPDGKTLASGGSDRTVRLWDVQTGEMRATLTTNTDRVASIAISPDGKTLASGSLDKTIKLMLMEAQTLTITRTLTGHTDWVQSVAFSPDGTKLASASDDKSIRFWYVQTGASQGSMTATDSRRARSVAYSSDGKVLATGDSDNKVRIMEEGAGYGMWPLSKTLTGHKEAIWSIAFSPDGKTLASGSVDRTVKLWDVKTGALKQTLTGHADKVYSVAFSPDGKTVASGSGDQTIKLWDVQTGALKQTLTGHTDDVAAVAFSPNGRILASGSWDKTIKLWLVD